MNNHPGTTEWTCTCKDCSKDFRYSNTNYEANAVRGFSRPERCPTCRAIHSKEVNTVGQPYFTVKPLHPGVNHEHLTSVLGKLDHPPRPHRAEHVVPPGEPPDKFGIKDDKITELFRWFSQDPGLQVAVVVGPTGSGKSTYLPYRLVHPPRTYSVSGPDGAEQVFDASDVQPDIFHRYGQVVVTQPRIQATRGIPGYIAKAMLGSSLGAGFDIGYQHAGNPASDWRSKLRFCTDGSLINWIATGQLDKINTVMIDEAHERSLNIDIIIGLLTQALPRYPRLKLIIASATISADLFIKHFERHLPKKLAVRELRISPDTRKRRGLERKVTKEIRVDELLANGESVERKWFLKDAENCELMDFPGKSFRVDPHFHEGPALDYAFLRPDPRDEQQKEEAEKIEGRLKRLASVGPENVAKKAVELLEDMYLSPEDLRAGKGIRTTKSLDPDGTIVDGRIVDITERRGDVLGFLHGEKPILKCCEEVKKLVGSSFPCRVEPLPLFTTLPQSAQDKALQERTPGHQDKLVARIKAVIADGATDILAVHDTVGQFAELERLLTETDEEEHDQAETRVRVQRWAQEDAVTIQDDGNCAKRDGATLVPRSERHARVVIASSRALAVWDVPYDSTEEGTSVSLAGETFRFVAQEPEVRRVVVSTNVAETSLTIHGILHVVDSGLINQNKWVPETETTAIRPILQSRAGCKQRWGRAGRLQAGDAWPLYSRDQFGLDEDVDRDPGEPGDPRCFPYYSQPEIRRSPLEQILLTAKKAGLESLDVTNFPWLEAPEEEELKRAERSLVAKGALTDNGHLTAHGLELSGFQTEARLANLMVIADRMACAVEMATVLAALMATNQQVRRKLLLQDHEWDDVTKKLVQERHEALIGSCHDDLEMVLKVIAGWELARSAGQTLADLWAWLDTWTALTIRLTNTDDSGPPPVPGTAELLDRLAEADEEEIFALRPGGRDALRPIFDTARMEATRGTRIRKRWEEASPRSSMITAFDEYERAWRSAATEQSRIECVAEEVLGAALDSADLDAFVAVLDGIETRSAPDATEPDDRSAEEIAAEAEACEADRREQSERFLAKVSEKMDGREEPLTGAIGRVVAGPPQGEVDEASEMAWRNLEDAAREFTKTLGGRFRVPREDHPGRAVIERIEAARSLDDLSTIACPSPWMSRVREALPAATGAAWCAANFVDGMMIADKDKIAAMRDDLIDSLSGHKKEDERRPLNFALLNRLRVIFAHALGDHCYEAREATLTPVLPGPNDLPGEIDQESVCADPAPSLLVCTSRRALPPNTAGERKLGLGFVVSLDTCDFRITGDMIRGANGRPPLAEWSAFDLTALLPTMSSDEEAVREVEETRRRFLADQRFPLHSRWRFTLVACVDGGEMWETEPTFVAPSPPIVPGYRNGRDESDSAFDEPEGAGGDFTTSTFAGETADPVFDFESEAYSDGGPRRPIGPTVRTPQGAHLQAEDDDREAQLLNAMDQAEDAEAPAPTPAPAKVLPSTRCRVRFLDEADAAPRSEGDCVEGWVLDADGSPEGAILTVGTTDPGEALATIVPGRDYRVEVLARVRSGRGGIRVWVVGTQAITTMTPRDFGFRDDSAVTDAFMAARDAAGGHLAFDATAWVVDRERRHLRLTTWSAVTRWLADNGYPERGILVASSPSKPDRVSVLLHQEPERGLVIVAEGRSEQFNGIEPGSEIAVRVSRPRDERRSPRVRVDTDLAAYSEALFEERLATRQPGWIKDLDARTMSLDRRDAILAKGPNDPAFLAAIDELFEQSNQLFADEAGAAAATEHAIANPDAPIIACITSVKTAGVELETTEAGASLGMKLWMAGRTLPDEQPDWMVVGRLVVVRPTGEPGGAGQLPVTCLPPVAPVADVELVGQVFRGRLAEVDEERERVLVKFGATLQVQCPAQYLGLGRYCEKSHLRDAQRRLAEGSVDMDFEVTAIEPDLRLSRQRILRRQIDPDNIGKSGAVEATVVESSPNTPFVNLRITDFVVAGCHESEFGNAQPRPGAKTTVIVEDFDNQGNLRASHKRAYYRMFDQYPPKHPFYTTVKETMPNRSFLETATGIEVYAPGSLVPNPGDPGSRVLVRFKSMNKPENPGRSPIVVTSRNVDPHLVKELPILSASVVHDLSSVSGRTDLRERKAEIDNRPKVVMKLIDDVYYASDTNAFETAIDALYQMLAPSQCESDKMKQWIRAFRTISSFGLRSVRVYQLAKELSVTSKSIVNKCKQEGIKGILHHLSPVEVELQATIREWMRKS